VLAEQGVSTVFCYPSETNLALLNAFRTVGDEEDQRIELVQTQLEEALSHAASGFSKASGKPAVVCTGGGAAGVSLLSGMLDGHLDSTPMIVLTGQVRREWIGRNALRESDLIGLSTAVTKHSFRIQDVHSARSIVEAAFELAQTGRPGVVLVEIPEDLQSATSDPVKDDTFLRGYRLPEPPAEKQIRALKDSLREAARPVLLLGGGTQNSARAWTKVAEKFRLPVVTSFAGKGVFPETHPQALGVVGTAGRKAGMYALAEADWLLAVGCRFSDRLTGADENLNREDMFVCHADIDSFELGKNVDTDLAIHCDASALAEQLLQHASDSEASKRQVEWLNRCAAAAGFCLRCVEHSADEGVHPKHVMDALNETKRSSDIVVTGTGLSHLFAAHFLLHQQPRTFVLSGGAAAKASGLPRALGAAISTPNERVYLIDGEVSFSARVQEFALAQKLGLNLKAIIIDNSSMGWIDQVSEDQSEPQAPAGSEAVDFITMAQTLGVETYSASTNDEFREALTAVQDQSGPAVIRVKAPSGVRMSPTMPVGGTFAEYGGICMSAPGVFYSEDEERVLRESAFGREDDEP
jgi:acetolactate synthase-1/2/3 large subunit